MTREIYRRQSLLEALLQFQRARIHGHHDREHEGRQCCLCVHVFRADQLDWITHQGLVPGGD